MKLNIYHRGKIEKTYETETHRVLYGTIRKISKISDSITVTASDDSEFYNSILKIISCLFCFVPHIRRKTRNFTYSVS